MSSLLNSFTNFGRNRSCRSKAGEEQTFSHLYTLKKLRILRARYDRPSWTTQVQISNNWDSPFMQNGSCITWSPNTNLLSSQTREEARKSQIECTSIERHVLALTRSRSDILKFTDVIPGVSWKCKEKLDIYTGFGKVGHSPTFATCPYILRKSFIRSRTRKEELVIPRVAVRSEKTDISTDHSKVDDRNPLTLSTSPKLDVGHAKSRTEHPADMTWDMLARNRSDTMKQRSPMEDVASNAAGVDVVEHWIRCLIEMKCEWEKNQSPGNGFAEWMRFGSDRIHDSRGRAAVERNGCISTSMNWWKKCWCWWTYSLLPRLVKNHRKYMNCLLIGLGTLTAR
jgi:hypothetical protein